MNVELKSRIEEVGIVVDPCQLLRAAPGVLKDLDENVAHQRLLQQLRVLPKVEFAEYCLSASGLFDVQEILIVQAVQGDCHQAIGNHFSW